MNTTFAITNMQTVIRYTFVKYISLSFIPFCFYGFWNCFPLFLDSLGYFCISCNFL